MKKYKPIVIAIILTILAFTTGYYSNSKPENVAKSYLASKCTKENNSFSCKEISFSILSQDKHHYIADYSCTLYSKDEEEKVVKGRIQLEKKRNKWHVIIDH